jgi:hypothetical protein
MRRVFSIMKSEIFVSAYKTSHRYDMKSSVQQSHRLELSQSNSGSKLQLIAALALTIPILRIVLECCLLYRQ